MSHSLRPHSRVTPSLDQVNQSIRQLMQEPVSDERTATYAMLLAQWADVRRDAAEQAA